MAKKEAAKFPDLKELLYVANFIAKGGFASQSHEAVERALLIFNQEKRARLAHPKATDKRIMALSKHERQLGSQVGALYDVEFTGMRPEDDAKISESIDIYLQSQRMYQLVIEIDRAIRILSSNLKLRSRGD